VSDISLERALPSNTDAERSVLGAILLDNAALIAFNAISPEDFYGPAHRSIARKMVEMRTAGKVVDLVTLDDELTRAGELEQAGGLAYVAGLVDGVPRISNVLDYARIVKGRALLRRLIHVCNATIQQAYETADNPEETLDLALQTISELAQEATATKQDGVTYREAAQSLLKQLDQREEGIRIFTDIAELDRITGGFRPSELILFTAETGVGKTLLAQQMRRRMCRDGQHTLFANAEMTAENLIARELATEAGVEHWKMRRPERITPDEMKALLRVTSHECRRCRIVSGELSLARIRLAARNMKSEVGLDCVVADYDELIDAPGKDEWEEQRSLVRGLKALAVELSIPVVLISQLRKLLQGEDRKRPTLQRLYGSGVKSKHPSCIVYVDREYVRELCGDETAARVCVLKNRSGAVGAIDAYFNIRTLRFESVSQPSGAPPPVAQDSQPSLLRGDRQLPPRDRE
jgi:replicative DNA helicase